MRNLTISILIKISVLTVCLIFLVILALLIYMCVKKQKSKYTKGIIFIQFIITMQISYCIDYLCYESMHVPCTERKPVYLESNEAYDIVERNQREQLPTSSQYTPDSALYEHIITTELNVCYETVPVANNN